MSLTVRNILIVSALTFVAVLGFYHLSVSIANSQPVPSLDAGPVTSDIATKPPESVQAVPAVDAPDPVAQPVDFADKVYGLYKSGALVPAVLLALYGLLLLARSRIAWLRAGKNAVYTAAAVTFLTGCAEAASRGTTPTLGVIVSALFAAITLALNPTKAQA